MSDVQNSPELDQAIQSLKKKADLLGIAYKSNVSVATLQKAISEKMEGTSVALKKLNWIVITAFAGALLAIILQIK